MTSLPQAMAAYRQAHETVAPLQQIVLLYDGAARRIRDAQEALAARRVQERVAAIEKAVAIIEGLQAGLDHQRGGEIARNLDRLYTHVTFRLHDLNLACDPGIGDEVLRLLNELRDAWAELARRGPTPPPAAAPGPADSGSVTVTI